MVPGPSSVRPALSGGQQAMMMLALIVIVLVFALVVYATSFMGSGW